MLTSYVDRGINRSLIIGSRADTSSYDADPPTCALSVVVVVVMWYCAVLCCAVLCYQR
jgi:hypothetical protein